MADSQWVKRFRPVLGDAVTLLSGLDYDLLLDKLAERSLLTFNQHEQLSEGCKSQRPEAAARRIFSILRRRRRPSFRIFCEVLSQLENGHHLLECLQGRSPTQAIIPSTTSGREAKVEETLEYKTPPPFPSSREQLSLPESSLEDASGGFPSLPSAREKHENVSAATASSMRCPVTFFCEREFESSYSRQRELIHCLINNLCKLLYQKEARIVTQVLSELYKTSKPDCSVEVRKKVKFKIIFPNIECPENFKDDVEDFKKNIAAVMACDKAEDVEILLQPGSCILLISVSGHAFIQFLVALASHDNWDFLFTLDYCVQIEIGTFPASLSSFLLRKAGKRFKLSRPHSSDAVLAQRAKGSLNCFTTETLWLQLNQCSLQQGLL